MKHSWWSAKLCQTHNIISAAIQEDTSLDRLSWWYSAVHFNLALGITSTHSGKREESFGHVTTSKCKSHVLFFVDEITVRVKDGSQRAVKTPKKTPLSSWYTLKSTCKKLYNYCNSIFMQVFLSTVGGFSCMSFRKTLDTRSRSHMLHIFTLCFRQGLH